MSSENICDQTSWNNLNEITWDYFSDTDWGNFVFYLIPGSIQQFYYNSLSGSIKVKSNATSNFKTRTYMMSPNIITSQVKITKGTDLNTSNIKVNTSIKE